jgi:catechol 2,3-dioxygenase-like lactoylglutathione lyase family enzyme/predicted enzyme related to lactoylglutathione lyase
MTRRLVSAASTLLLLAVASTASAQLLVAKDGPIVYGHHHVNATSLEEHKKFFVNTLGGTAIKVGTNNAEIVKFPNVLIFLRQQAPKGGTKGTTVNHIGFSVPNLRQAVDKIKANGYRLVTREEATADREVKDDIGTAAGRNSIAYAMGPDELKVELVENTQQTAPIMMHHVHYAGEKNAEMQAWYLKVFGAKEGTGGGGAFTFPTANLPGVALNFSPSTEPVVGTQGRALDHIGFEVKGLEAFCKKLEQMGIKLAVDYRKVPALDIAIAFITDPWGTYIELTEGLDKVS